MIGHPRLSIGSLLINRTFESSSLSGFREQQYSYLGPSLEVYGDQVSLDPRNTTSILERTPFLGLEKRCDRRSWTLLSSFDHRNCFDPNVLLQHTCDPWEDCFPRYIHRTQLPMDFCRPFKHHLIFYSSHDPCTIQVDDPCSASLRYPCSYVPRKHTT